MSDPNKLANRFWISTVVCAFSSFISFIQINSYASDKHGLNGVWTVAGIVFGVAAIYSLYRVSQNTNSGGDN